MILKIDGRERNDEVYETLFTLCEEAGHTIQEENQDVGDYAWFNDDGSHTGIAVEMKLMHTDDLFKSLQSGHLDSQVLDLCQYPHPILLIVGKYDPLHYRGKFTRNQLIAKIASVTIRTGTKPVWFDRISDACQFILQLPTQLAKGEKTDVIASRHSKTRNREDHNLNQFLSLPSVGRKRAEALNEEYKLFFKFLQSASEGHVPDLPKGAREYVATICGVDVEDLIPLLEKFCSIPGIGKASAEKFIAEGHDIDSFYQACKDRQVKMSVKTCRWLEDEIWRREKQRVTISP